MYISELKSAHTPANSIFSGPVTNLIGEVCVLMKSLTRANEKNTQKGLRISNFLLLLVVFK